MKILVTDDSKMARRMVKKTLAEVTTPEDEIFEGVNGVEAVEIYKEKNPDIVFLDLTMPEKSGFEALDEIIAMDPKAKVIIISADIQKTAMERVKESGAIGFIKKPIDSNKMKEIFEKLRKV